jgi:rRNA maturation endonuclease Nob1
MLLFGSLCGAKSIAFDYPEEVIVGEKFDVSVKLVDFEEDTYDIKIDILDNGNRISKILNHDKWLSTFYYVSDILTEEESFTMSVIEDFEKAEITVKIRDSEEKVDVFVGYEIRAKEVVEEDRNEEKEERELEEFEERMQRIRGEPEEEVEKPIGTTGELIVLSTKDIKSEKNVLDKDKLAKIGLIVFSIVIVVLFVFNILKWSKKKKSKLL